MHNLYQQFRQLLPGAPLQAGTVIEVNTRGMSGAQRREGLASALAFAREHLEGTGDAPVRISPPTRKRYRS